MKSERKRVLVVDYDESVRESVSDIVSLLGFKVARVSTVREGILSRFQKGEW